MALAVVAIHWGGLQDLRREILCIGGGSFHYLSAGLAHTDIGHLKLLGGRTVAENQLTVLLHPSLALHQDGGRDFANARAVIFITHSSRQLLDQGRFPRCIV